MPFDYTLDFKKINFRASPELYRIGKGEQGVLLVEPYKSEILPYWRFKTPEIAQKSADEVYRLFLDYLAQCDFIGADMARKFLQMGYTRARRYANHKSGRKYAQNPQLEESRAAEKEARKKYLLPNTAEDPVKAAAAAIFKEKWTEAKNNILYKQLFQEHLAKFGK
ncbi:hypothetical protein AAE02nite_19710 [Adhaeribacter aerolatus]|uniref:DUF4385 domain-containing protein n=1 Tax=Adhaeribacter aerolatus TaxID=670289 RepID=A0A512AXR4_9BACT|nr:DUF4385 domain-containing protein [Adhaeribacter aerolatus]GEO04307.1 hypothetical protein AAE02nite_19710 [Adhaeribacter aerolatus]